MGLNYEQRAKDNFRASRERMAHEIRALIARHTADGMLQSGSTAKKTVSIFEQASADALAKSLDEMGKHTEHRGRAWRRAAQGISRALDDHLVQSKPVLSKSLGMAGAAGDTAAARAVEGLLAAAGMRLRAQLSEFQEGWTAPPPKPFKDRHPTWDRLLFLFVGGAIGLSLQAIWAAWISR